MYMALNAPLYATRRIVGILKMLDEFVHSGLNGVIVADLGLLFAVEAFSCFGSMSVRWLSAIMPAWSGSYANRCSTGHPFTLDDDPNSRIGAGRRI